MMVEKEDLGLALSLGCNHGSKATPATQNQQQRSAFQLNLMPSMFASSSSTSLTVPNLHFSSAKNVQNPSWLDSFHSSSSDRTSIGGGAEAGKGTVDPRSFLRGIDVNRLPANAADDEEAGVSSPNSTISSVSGKRSEREVTIRCGVSAGGDDLDLGSRGMSDEEDGDTSRKKLRLSKDQSAILEESFKEHSTLNPKQKLALAKRLGLRPRQVEVWFQNRRVRTKLKQTEVDCEFLKRCCEQLTEENRRLQKEVQELRQLKLSPQFYMQMAPPTTLTMCPSCERVGAPSSSGAATASTANGPHHRGFPLSPWGTPAPVPIRPFEALHPRS